MSDEVKLSEMMPIEDAEIKDLIYVVRGQQVMLDSDLARLYGVETRALNQAVARNPKRFPERFCSRSLLRRPRG